MSRVVLLIFLGFFALENASACLMVPRKIRFSGTSFVNEPISIGPSAKGVGLYFNTDYVFFHPLKKRWCVVADKAEYCELTKFDVKDESTGTLIGQAELNSKTEEILIFSVDNNKKKTLKKPYLRVSQKSGASPGPGNYFSELQVQAVDQAQVVGEATVTYQGNLNSETGSITSATRSIGMEDGQDYELRGHSMAVKGCGPGSVSPYRRSPEVTDSSDAGGRR